jgi:hypothetical protein
MLVLLVTILAATVSVAADLSPKKLFAQPGFDTTIKSLT